MGKRLFSAQNYTPTAQADTTNLTDGTYQALQGGSSTQINRISEIGVMGLAAASGPTLLTLARDSTVGATPTALAAPNTDGPLHPSFSALSAPAVAFVAATTKPQRSSSASLPRLPINLNAFGGIYRWAAVPGSEFIILGNTASNGEASLSAINVGTSGLLSSELIYETE